MEYADVERYLKRTGSSFQSNLDEAYLKDLQFKHLNTFPFEGINPLLGLSVDLSPEKLIDKFLNHQRGGYCFEQNLFFKQVLEALGFQVRTVLGRVIESNPNRGRTHLVNIVEIGEEKYLTDVGFGGFNSPQPLQIIQNQEVQTPLNTYRIVKEEPTLYFQVLTDGDWKGLYSFDFNIYNQGDFEVANWYTSTNPKTTFTQQLNLAIIDQNKRYHLKNNAFSIIESGILLDKITLTSLVEMNEVLLDYFKLDASYLPGWANKVKEILG